MRQFCRICRFSLLKTAKGCEIRMKKTGMRILGAALVFSLIAGIAPAADLTAHAEQTTSLGIDYDCGDSTFFSRPLSRIWKKTSCV